MEKMNIIPEFPSIVFDDQNGKFSIEITAKDAIEADKQRTQLLQNQQIRKAVEDRLDMAKSLKDNYMIQLFTDILRH